MSKPVDRRARAALFRARLGQAMAQAGLTQADLARASGTDRSTISQLLAAHGTRLPNAQVVAECARALSVSADWLLGLSDRPERGADLVSAAVAMPEAPRALIDEQLFAWHRAAEGQKIRHVPAHLPDMLKTPDFLRWEYEPALGRTTDQAIGAAADRLGWMQAGRTDYELALPLHEIRALARSEGYCAGLPPAIARAQVAHMAALAERLFPRLRIALFDGRRLYSAPVTIFGPQIAAIYLGQNWLTFRDTERVQALTRHFDLLVREAQVADRAVAGWLRAMA